MLAQALTLLDGLAVIGGGISGSWPLFLPSLVDAMNGVFDCGTAPQRRLVQHAFNLEDAAEREAFIRGEVREVRVPGSSRTVRYDPLARTGVGLSRLETSEAVAIGAYAFALNRLG